MPRIQYYIRHQKANTDIWEESGKSAFESGLSLLRNISIFSNFAFNICFCKTHHQNVCIDRGTISGFR